MSSPAKPAATDAAAKDSGPTSAAEAKDMLFSLTGFSDEEEDEDEMLLLASGGGAGNGGGAGTARAGAASAGGAAGGAKAPVSAVPRKRGETEMSVLKYKLSQ